MKLDQPPQTEQVGDKLQEHMAKTYRNLRMGLVAVGLVFPFFLGFFGYYWYGIRVQPSLSDYYYAKPEFEGSLRVAVKSIFSFENATFSLGRLDDVEPMRIWFVGFLFVLGVCLFLYQGYDRLENWLLNGAGVFGLGVALFPMEVGCGNVALGQPKCHDITLHAICAIVAFICFGIVGSFSYRTTLKDLPLSVKAKRNYTRIYVGLGVATILYPIIVTILTKAGFYKNYATLIIESIGILLFVLYWLTKSIELRQAGTVRQAEAQAAAQAAPSEPGTPAAAQAVPPMT
jgi:hypothetical protein